MLKAGHSIDTEFKYSSSFLKNNLVKLKYTDGSCLDIPCGNGRNIFLIAKYFRTVTGVDIREDCLKVVGDSAKLYDLANIRLSKVDVVNDVLTEISSFKLICNIHYYSKILFENLVANMGKGNFLLLETPSCNGGNFNELPSEIELKNIIGANELRHFEFKKCHKVTNIENRGSVKLLLKKI